MKNGRKKPRGYVKRSEEQRLHDLQFCTNLFLRGYSYREIADALNRHLAEIGLDYKLSHIMIFYDIKQCLIEWKRDRLENIDEYVTKELQKLDKMEQETWEAWEKSKTGTYKTIEKKNIGRPRKPGATDEDPEYYGYNQEQKETSCGNPRFLDLLLNIQQRRAKMLGFDAPVKIDIPGVNASMEDDKPKYNVKAIPDDLLFAVADKLQSAEFDKITEEKGGI